MTPNILAPGAVLILWTLVMLVWTAVTRFRALANRPSRRAVDSGV